MQSFLEGISLIYAVRGTRYNIILCVCVILDEQGKAEMLDSPHDQPQPGGKKKRGPKKMIKKSLMGLKETRVLDKDKLDYIKT